MNEAKQLIWSLALLSLFLFAHGPMSDGMILGLGVASRACVSRTASAAWFLAASAFSFVMSGTLRRQHQGQRRPCA